MDIRHRTSSIVALRCHVCQDFLNMILVPDWKQKLYAKAQNAVESNFHRDNYIEAYNKMRDMGLDAYDVEYMDVSFVSVIVLFCGEIAPTQKSTKEAIKKLAVDRNATNHSDENESADELYLRGLLAVTDIISFIKTVDLSESTISDDDRLRFRTKWMKEAEALRSLLDSERIEYVQIQKEIEQDIKKIKEAENKLVAWGEVHEKYFKYYWKTPRYSLFVIAASNAGILNAHTYAASCSILERDYDEFFRRLGLLCSPDIHLGKGDAFSILEELNQFLWLGNKETPQFAAIVDYLSQNGFDIYQNEHGYYKLRK